MKKTIKTALCIMLTAILILSTLGIAQAASIWDAEPKNNTSSGASVISVNNTVTGNLNEYDQDWYSITLSSPGFVSISLSAPYKATTDRFCFFKLKQIVSGSETDFISSELFFTDRSTRTYNIGLPSGTYLVVIYDTNHSNHNYNSAAQGEQYSLTVNYTASNSWETEKNDTSLTADACELNRKYYASLTRSESDWFSFHVSSPSYVSVTLDTAYKSSTDRFCFYRVIKIESGKETELDSGSLFFSPASVTGKKIGIDPGQYFVQIYDANHSNWNYNSCAEGEDYGFVISSGSGSGGSSSACTVTFDGNGGIALQNRMAAEVGAVITLPSATRIGYSCLGWSVNENASGAEYSVGAQYTVTNDVTLHAVWQKNPTQDIWQKIVNFLTIILRFLKSLLTVLGR